VGVTSTAGSALSKTRGAAGVCFSAGRPSGGGAGWHAVRTIAATTTAAIAVIRRLNLVCVVILNVTLPVAAGDPSLEDPVPRSRVRANRPAGTPSAASAHP
jgi:hypothetical protein